MNLFQFRNSLFQEDYLYQQVKAFASENQLTDTLHSLAFMKNAHSGQYRKPMKYATQKVAYINHPLTMACHAYALGICDDEILAAILLHDVVEDTDADYDDLPVNQQVKEIVSLLTFKKLDYKTKAEAKQIYYDHIRKNKKACIIKIIDRCNNVSTMSGSFTKEKLIEYIDETEQFIMPLLPYIQEHYPEYNHAVFVIQYQLTALSETIKVLISEQQ